MSTETEHVEALASELRSAPRYIKKEVPWRVYSIACPFVYTDSVRMASVPNPKYGRVRQDLVFHYITGQSREVRRITGRALGYGHVRLFLHELFEDVLW
jgi:hypothetical protein